MHRYRPYPRCFISLSGMSHPINSHPYIQSYCNNCTNKAKKILYAYRTYKRRQVINTTQIELSSILQNFPSYEPWVIICVSQYL